MHRVAFAAVVATAAAFVGGCASQRLNYMAPQYAQGLGDFHHTEVLVNLARTIDDPNHIPTQTSISAGKLDYTDTDALSVSAISLAAPAHTGTFGVSVGNLIDTYEVQVAPTEDATELRRIRNLYRSAVYNERWLYWSDGPVERQPPPGAIDLGHYGGHHMWTTNLAALDELILDTFEGPKAKAKAQAKAKATPGSSPNRQLLITPNGVQPAVPQ